jgi:hypothetical protein
MELYPDSYAFLCNNEYVNYISIEFLRCCIQLNELSFDIIKVGYIGVTLKKYNENKNIDVNSFHFEFL